MKKMLVVFVLLALVLVGCEMSDSGIPGRYESTIALIPVYYVELYSNGTYSEGTISLWKDEELDDGTWSAAGNTVTLDNGFNTPSVIVIDKSEFDYDGLNFKKK